MSDSCFGRLKRQSAFHVHKRVYSKKAIQEIKDILKNNGLDPQLFNSFSFKMACRNLNIRDKEKYCHKITLYKNPMYQYSLSAIEFISNEFINNKSVFEECKSRTNKQKTDKPKLEEFSFMPIVFAKHELLEYTNPWRRYHDLSVSALYRKAQINGTCIKHPSIKIA